MALRDKWNKIDLADIAKLLGRSSNSCRQRAHRLGLIAKSPDKLVSRPKEQDDALAAQRAAEKKHLDYVAGLPCAVRGPDCAGRVEVHHVRVNASKRDHKQVMPLCAYHHRDQKNGYHGLSRRGFDKRYGIDCLALSRRLWRERNPI